MRLKSLKFELSNDNLISIIDSLDDTGGYLIKASELRYWIEYFVNKDRKQRSKKEDYAIRKFISKLWNSIS